MAKVEKDISATIKFRDICTMLDKLKGAPIPRKETVLRRYYDSFCRHRISFRMQQDIPADQEETGVSSFYSVLRLLLPRADTARDAYNLQTTALGRLYIKVLQLSSDSKDAKSLQARSYSSIRGDYADIVFSVLWPRCQRSPSNLTVKQVHQLLDTIAKEDIKSKEREITRFTEQASATEQKWLIRLLLKRMNLGIGEQRIFAILHPLAEKLYQRCANLSTVCTMLADNKIANVDLKAGGDQLHLDLNQVIEPFQQIRPMLCERFHGKIEDLMDSDVLYMETKMDGERFQIHFANGCFKYISRNGADYTYSFGNSFEQGNLTPRLKDLLPLSLQSVIIDGEMMVWDKVAQRFRDKGENTEVKHLNANKNWQPCFIAFDLLYLNGCSLLDLNYVQRTYKLQELLKEKPGVLQVMRPKMIASIEDFQRMFQDELDSNAEGIVLKKQNSIYKPGARIGGGWYKDKADYIKDLTTEFDVLIIGGFYNRKRTFIESFLLGVLKHGIGQRHDEVYSIGKVANNTQQRIVLNHTLKPHWRPIESEPPPLWYHYKDVTNEGRPDVWIEPKDSTILQIKAADLTSYSAFATAKSLHFPRTVAWRNDKVWNECMTLQEFTQLYQGGQVGIKKINKRQLCLEDFTTERKKQKLTEAQKRRLALESYEKAFDASKVATTSDLFDGFKFCILSGSPRRRYHKQDLQDLAASNGGTIVAHPLPNNPKCICIAGDITHLVERLKLQQPRTNDIVNMDWLLRTCERQQIHLRPKDMISMTDALQAQFAKSYDSWGDSYTDYITSVDEMQEILDDMSDEQLNGTKLSLTQLMTLEKELQLNNSLDFYGNTNAYFYKCRQYLSKILYQQHGGHCLNNADIEAGKQLSCCVDFIFVDLRNLNKNEFSTWHGDNFEDNYTKVVNIDWITCSHNAKNLLDISDYIIQI